MILLDRITKTYPGDEEPALDNVSLHIEPHEFVFLVGKSGAGKSTLIKMITKEEQPDSGKIIIGGIDLDYVKKRHIPHYRRRLGVVFQDYKLLPSRTVFENVAFALEIAGMRNREIERTVPKVLELVGLGEKGHKFPRQLSGGERQRVSIARSVARQPKILIADEPTGNLDPLTRGEIIDLLQKINDFGTTVLVTTHDENIVNNLSKRVITMKDGRIVNDQKNNGIYRLDNEPVTEVPAFQKIMTYGIRDSRTGANMQVNNTPATNAAPAPESALKIQHPTRRKVTKTPVRAVKGSTAIKDVAAKTPSRAEPKVQTKNQSRITKPPKAQVKTPTKKLAQDSANQWYAASRPLKAAPKLSDFSLGQTVKLKPAPSMSQAIKTQSVAPKVKTKRVI